MPCSSSHMEPSHFEHELSTVACLLDELDGVEEIPESWRRGHHPKVYGKRLSRADLDFSTRFLCGRLQDIDVTKQSLEMQIWWRDHQKADRERVDKELEKAKDVAAKATAIAKLTEYERNLLGL